MLVYTDKKRDSSDIILSQKKSPNNIIKYYDELKKLNKPILNAIRKRKCKRYWVTFNIHWELKKSLSKKISDKKN